MVKPYLYKYFFPGCQDHMRRYSAHIASCRFVLFKPENRPQISFFLDNPWEPAVIVTYYDVLIQKNKIYYQPLP